VLNPLRTSLVVVLFSGMAFSLIRPALAFKLRMDLGSTALEVTSLTTGFMLARAISSPIGGLIGDKYPRLRNLIASTLLFPTSIVSLLLYMSQDSRTIISLNFLHGMFSGIFWPTVQVIVGLTSPREKRGTFLGLYFTVAGVGSSIGYSLYGALPLSNQEFILLSSILYFISALFSILFLSNRNRENNPSRTLNEIPENEVINPHLILISAFLLGGLMGLSGEYLYIFLREVHNLSKAELGYLLTASSIVGVVSGISSGFLSDLLGIRRSLFLLAVMASVSLFLISTPYRVIVIPSVLAMFFSAWGSMPLTRNVSAFKRASGTLVGLSNTSSNLGSAIFPLTAGHFYDYFGSEEVILGLRGATISFLILSILLLLLSILLVKGIRNISPSH